MTDHRLCVRQQNNERFDSHRIAQLAKGQGGSVAYVAVWIGEAGHQGLSQVRVGDAPQKLNRRDSYLEILIREQLQEMLAMRRIGVLLERLGRSHAHAVMSVAEAVEQRVRHQRDRFLSQRNDRLQPDNRVGVARPLEQGLYSLQEGGRGPAGPKTNSVPPKHRLHPLKKAVQRCLPVGHPVKNRCTFATWRPVFTNRRCAQLRACQ